MFAQRFYRVISCVKRAHFTIKSAMVVPQKYSHMNYRYFSSDLNHSNSSNPESKGDFSDEKVSQELVDLIAKNSNSSEFSELLLRCSSKASVEMIEKIYLALCANGIASLADYELVLVRYAQSNLMLKARNIFNHIQKEYPNKVISSSALECLMTGFYRVSDIVNMKHVFMSIETVANSRIYNLMILAYISVGDSEGVLAITRKMGLKQFHIEPRVYANILKLNDKVTIPEVRSYIAASKDVIHDQSDFLYLYNAVLSIFAKKGQYTFAQQIFSDLQLTVPLNVEHFNYLIEAALNYQYNPESEFHGNPLKNYPGSVNLETSVYTLEQVKSIFEKMNEYRLIPNDRSNLLRIKAMLKANDTLEAFNVVEFLFKTTESTTSLIDSVLVEEVCKLIFRNGYEAWNISKFDQALNSALILMKHFKYSPHLSLYTTVIHEILMHLNKRVKISKDKDSSADDDTKSQNILATNNQNILSICLTFLKHMETAHNPPLYATATIYSRLIDELANLKRYDEAYPLVNILESKLNVPVPERHESWLLDHAPTPAIVQSNETKSLPIISVFTNHYERMNNNPISTFGYAYSWLSYVSIGLLGCGFLLFFKDRILNILELEIPEDEHISRDDQKFLTMMNKLHIEYEKERITAELIRKDAEDEEMPLEIFLKELTETGKLKYSKRAQVLATYNFRVQSVIDSKNARRERKQAKKDAAIAAAQIKKESNEE